MKKVLGLLLVSLFISGGDLVFAQGRGRGPKPPTKDDKAEIHGDHGRRARERDGVAIDRDRYRHVIVDYYRGGLPPGLAKRDELPPGLRKQLRERGTLPPGLEKRLVVVPAPLVRRLPPVPAPYGRYFLGSDLVILDRQRHVILEIIPDVVPSWY
jgi:hypothetical protein